MLSIEARPPPYISKKTNSKVIAKSVRPSCAITQNPLPTNSGHFVVAKATAIITSKGNVASRVSNPSTNSNPQMISKLPVNGAQKVAG